MAPPGLQGRRSAVSLLRGSGGAKPREIDVVALFADRNDGSHVVSVAIECKSKPPPFIVLLPSQYEPAHFRCLSKNARGRLPMPRDYAWMDLRETPLFSFDVPVGHAILTKSGSGEDDSGDRRDRGWTAVMSACKAAAWFATRRDAAGPGSEVHASFPVVVTSGTLATAALAGEDLEVHEVDHARCILKWPFGATPGAVIVDVVTSRKLPVFAAGCAAAANELLTYWQEQDAS